MGYVISPVRPRIAFERQTSTSRTLLVADVGCASAAVHALDRAVDPCTTRVSVVALPEHVPVLVAAFAPLSGMWVNCRREALQRAERAAGQIAGKVPVAQVDHRVVPDWAHVVDLVQEGCFDLLVLAREPERRRDLRRLVAASGRAGTALVLGRG